MNAGDRKFEEAQEKMNLISRELQVGTINWYKNKYKEVQKEFQQVKVEFFRSTDQYAYEELRKKMNRRMHSYEEEENRKIKSLSSDRVNRSENVEPNKSKQSVKEKVKLIRRDTNKKVKRWKMRRQKERRRFKKIHKKRKNQRIEQEWIKLLEESRISQGPGRIRRETTTGCY